MQPALQPASVSKGRRRAGTIISAFCALFLSVDAAMKVINVAPVREAQARLGYPVELAPRLGMVLLVCTAVYVIPRTAVLGAILLTAYLGGATATHVRAGEPFFFPPGFGVPIWAGLYLRDERVRALIPVRRHAA